VACQPRLHDARLGDGLRGQLRHPLARARQRGGRPCVQVAGTFERGPVGQPAADDPERVVSFRARVAREHEARLGVRGGKGAAGAGAAERPHEHRDPLTPPAQPRGALEALLRGGRAHLRVDVREQRGAAVATAGEEAKRLVEAPAVEVRIEVVEARRQAAAHLPVRRRPRAQPQRAAAMTQPEQGVELLLELDRAGAAAQRPDRHGAAGGGLARHLEHRVRDVEAAAQVDEGVVVLVDLVARRAQRADETVLEDERAELRARPAVVDDRGLVGPHLGGRRRREVRAGARAQRDGLADVEHLAGGIAKDVDAGRIGQRGGVGLVALDRAAGDRAPGAQAWAAARGRQHRERVGDRRGMRAEAGEERAEDASARLGVRERAVLGLDLDPERVRECGEAALAHERGEAARERDRAQHRRIGPLELGPRERLAQDAPVERGVVRDEDPVAQLLGEIREDGVGGRRRVDHLLRDPREALDRPRQRRGAVDERLPAIVQLAPADEDGADLGQLARIPRLAVGLRVDDEELGGDERLREQVHERMFSRRPDGCTPGCSGTDRSRG